MHDALYMAWQMSILFLSTLSAGLMIFFYFHSPRTRLHPGPVLLCIFLSLTVANIFRIFLLTITSGPRNSNATLSDLGNKAVSNNVNDFDGYISAFFWLELFCSNAATSWYLMLALDLIFSLSNPFLPFNADNIKHHSYAWPAAVVWCFVFRVSLSDSKGSVTSHIHLFFNLPAYAVLIYISIALVNAWQKSRRLETHAHYTTRKIAKLILPYLILFTIATVITFFVYISEVSMGYETLTAEIVHQSAFHLQAFAVFALFCRDSGALHTFKANKSLDRVEIDQSQRTNVIFGSDPHEEERLDISNKLRKDIMKYTSMGILESVKETLKSAEMEQDVTYSDYSQVDSMSIVVHGAIDSVVLSFRDCASKVFHHLRQHFGVEPSGYMDSFHIDKILSECGSEGKSGNIFYFTGHRLVSSVFNSLFSDFFVANKQFMVKSVPKEEFDTLRAILPHYHRYLLSNPQSRLCRYFGCHSISLPVGKRRMYFVVMQNLFHKGPVHQRFDLKGNCDRRQAIGSHQVEDYMRLACAQRPIKKLMMDIDFHVLSNGIKVAPATSIQMQGQLCDDLVFLASRGIIDYSILLGVQYVNYAKSSDNSSSERTTRSFIGSKEPSFERPASSGMLGDDGEKLYFLGIVDMLQRYNWRWTVQRWTLGCLLCKDPHDVSAVPPEEYGSRLTDFVRSYLFDTPTPAIDAEESTFLTETSPVLVMTGSISEAAVHRDHDCLMPSSLNQYGKKVDTAFMQEQHESNQAIRASLMKNVVNPQGPEVEYLWRFDSSEESIQTISNQDELEHCDSMMASFSAEISDSQTPYSSLHSGMRGKPSFISLSDNGNDMNVY